MIVTIDGPAGAGKSTAARRLAARLGFEFLDTGAGYRAVALAAARAGLDAHASEQSLQGLVSGLHVVLDGGRLLLNGEDVTALIRAPEVSALASLLAERAAVRSFLTQWQRRHAAGRDLVTEGRDQGTAVFPDAPCK